VQLVCSDVASYFRIWDRILHYSNLNIRNFVAFRNV